MRILPAWIQTWNWSSIFGWAWQSAAGRAATLYRSAPFTSTILSFTMNAQFRFFFLARLRLCTLHYLVAFPEQAGWCNNLTPCPCNNESQQSTLCFTLFCTLEPRVRFLMPLLRETRPRNHQEGFNLLCSLPTEVCTAVLNFIRIALLIRKLYEM